MGYKFLIHTHKIDRNRIIHLSTFSLPLRVYHSVIGTTTLHLHNPILHHYIYTVLHHYTQFYTVRYIISTHLFQLQFTQLFSLLILILVSISQVHYFNAVSSTTHTEAGDPKCGVLHHIITLDTDTICLCSNVSFFIRIDC